MAKSFDDLVKKTMTPAARARAMRLAREYRAEMLLVELHKLTGTSQRQLASDLGVRAPSAARVAQFDDLSMADIKRLARSLGVALNLTARLSDSRAPRAADRVRPPERGRSRRAA